MLTSGGNQYLRPEYLSPLSSTLDSKKSPLALLAQTCSQIGADISTKPTNEKQQKGKMANGGSLSNSNSDRDKASPASSVSSNPDVGLPNNSASKPAFKPYESCLISETKDRTSPSAGDAARVKTPSKGTTPAPSSSSKTSEGGVATNGSRCGSNHSASSPRPSSSPAAGRKTPSARSLDDRTSVSKVSPSPRSSSASGNPSSSPAAAAAAAAAAGANSKLPFPPTGFLGGFPHLPLDLMAGALLSPHLKPGTAPSLNPYLNYPRLKAGEALPGACRDPYCTGCQLSSQAAAAAAAAAGMPTGKTPNGTSPSAPTGSCPSGCVQCDHVAKSGFMPPHSPGLAAAYAQAQLAALTAASQLPYVCSWIAGEAQYCGKRFPTSEELLQHLRTHTSVAPTSDPAAAATSAASLPLSAHSLLHRTYPAPPLSPARFHPYSKPPLMPPSSLGFPMHPHPGLPPYFSPYSLYGARLGTSGLPQ